MRKLIVSVFVPTLSLLSFNARLARGADAGVDAGVDGGAACVFGEADCTATPWMWCDESGAWVATDCTGAAAPLVYSPCNCAPEDPCGWAGDTICDEACFEVVDVMFDDSADCQPEPDGGADADSDSDTDIDADTDTETETDTADGGTVAADGDSGCGCAVVGMELRGLDLLGALFGGSPR